MNLFRAMGAVTTSAAVSITVNAAPTVSLTSPANNATFTAPATITLTATAADSDGTVTQVEFFQGTTLLATITSAPYTFTLNNVAAGGYSFTAKATDNQGANTTSAAVTVTVNALPTVTLTSPANGASFTAPASITVTAVANDSDGTITQVALFQGTTLLATLTAPPYTTTLNNVQVGSYTYTARGTDNFGGVTTSDPVTVTVASGVAQLYFIYTDQLNTPRVITNQAAQVVWRWDNNDPFGANVPNDDPNSTGNHFTFNPRFPGQYFDKETNTHYNYFRDYDPNTGRYIQSDPIGLDGGTNTFTYAGANPVSGIDTTGLLCTFSQATGAYTCVDDATGQTYLNGKGWSGQGQGMNNPAMQNVFKIGPIPRGCWQITSVTGTKGPNTLVLRPLFSQDPSNNNRDLSTFLIHAPVKDPSTRVLSSEGCIIIGPADRSVLARRVGEVVCVE